MDVILNISNPIHIIGNQIIREGEYRPSVYNYSVSLDDGYLVYNLFTRGLLLLSNDEYKMISSKCSSQDAIHNELLRFFVENYYFVPVNCDDQKYYLEVNDLIRNFDNKNIISSYTILTTTACNARCFYCFEKDFVPVSMTAQTANDLVKYMIKNSKDDVLKLSWFGGEPLCNTPVIDQICAQLRDSGRKFTSNITSNGYAFNEDIVTRAKNNWNTQFVQITLDGMEEEHNRRKNYKTTSDNPFLRTINNIHLLLNKEITVSIRVNVDINNTESVRELLSFLRDEFYGEKYLVVYIAKIFDDCGSWKSGRTAEESTKLNQISKEFSDFLVSNKMSSKKACTNSYKYHYCGANNIHHRTVSPEGKFLLCHNLSDEESFGSIYEGISNQQLYRSWMQNTEIDEKCDGCRFLPECTPFTKCPNIQRDCIHDCSTRLESSIISRYKRFLSKKDFQ